MADGNRFDPYRVLGVGRGATRTQVARAYRTLAKRLHPDLHGPDDSGRMQQLNRAFAVLSDPERRRDWDARHSPAPSEAHWTTGQRPPSAPAAAAGPSTWASWEAKRPAVENAPGRVRVEPGWPRARAAPAPAPVGIRDSAWLALGVSLVLVVAVLVLGWVAAIGAPRGSARQAISALGITPASTVALDPDHELAVYREADGRLGLVVAERGEAGWMARVLAEAAAPRPFSVLGAEQPGATGGPWRTMIYGRAQPGVERVRLVGADGAGGYVANGTWAIGLRQEVSVGSLRWEFVLPDGRVVLEGSGELGG